MSPPQSHGPRAAFTLIELVVVVAVILILVGMLVPAISFVQQSASRQQAAQVVSQLGAGLRTYAADDLRHRFPLHAQLYPIATASIPQPLALKPLGGASVGVLTLLEGVDVGAYAEYLDLDRQMIDPWGRPYCYQLTRPAAAPQDWNWDAAAARPKAWNAVNDTPAPYPYVWSYGRRGTPTDATGWIYDHGK